jgi:hypothetical protein
MPAATKPCVMPRFSGVVALQQSRDQLDVNRRLLLAIVGDIAPGLTDRYGVGPVTRPSRCQLLPSRPGAETGPHSPP